MAKVNLDPNWKLMTISEPTPAVVRVFLCTYRRNRLLRRAMASLLAQTFKNWVCELHNDDPGDAFPAQLAAEIADPRITVVAHDRNLGAIRTFNLMYEPRPEKYVSLLEDDNWWEESFLETMVKSMDAHPEVKVGWANMRLWREETDGTWTDLQRTVWDQPPGAGGELIQWPDFKQADTALHSQGAMLVRSGHLDAFQVPGETLLEFVEPVRERAMPHPLLFIEQPLANFAQTLNTARDKKSSGRLGHYVLLLASFFKHEHPEDQVVKAIWEKSRRAVVRSTHVLILAGLADRSCRRLLREARFSEWILCLLIGAKHPLNFLSALRAKMQYPELWAYLDRNTGDRFRQAGAP